MSGHGSSPITFIVPGQRNIAATRDGRIGALPGGIIGGTVKESVRVGAHRGAGEVSVTAEPGQDVVVLHIAGGPSLVLHPETARDLMAAQSTGSTRGLEGDLAAADGAVHIPTQLQWRGREAVAGTRGATRGLFGEVVLSAMEVITGLITDEAADFVAREVAARVDAQVNAGVYKLGRYELPSLKQSNALAELPAAANGISLVFVHGTFSNTGGTFGKLWTQRQDLVRQLFEHYGDAVYALDHPTLQASPIKNAVTLAQALPAEARLHLITHSRGGLVAEVLARACAAPPLRDVELGAFTAAEREELVSLARLLKEKRVRVERLVRVGCPARGTLLASKRLDAYLSVFKWTLELAGIPVVPELVDFLAAVAQRRTDPEMLPGLAAQIPDSPLVQWLHTPGNPIPGDLRVIAGDIEGDSLTSWLKTLLADSFYWTDNDFVVQTRSMYGGSPRVNGASFVLDQGGKVSHFAYFGNDRTAEAVVHAITQDEPGGFRVVGPLSWGGKSSSGERAMTPIADERPSSDKPVLIVIPDVLGSNLKINGRRIWLSSRLTGSLNRLAYDSAESDEVEPDGLVDNLYDDLIEYMSGTHEVVPFPYDWRRPLEEAAMRLAEAVEAGMSARKRNNLPVRILAHSNGGLVLRAMQLERPKVWQKILARSGARLLMLGTPNAGSWTPMQVLSGDETFGGTLTAGAAPFREWQVREIMGGFPGFVQTQAALLDSKLKLDQRETWLSLSECDLERLEQLSFWHVQRMQRDESRWGTPTQEALDRAVALHRRLQNQIEELGRAKDKLVVAIGQAKLTPIGFTPPAEEFAYLYAADCGDGRVTLDSALLPGVPAWTAPCDHAQLPSHKACFSAYLELLEKGTTNLLSPVTAAAAIRAAAEPAGAVRLRPSRTPATAEPPERPQQVFAVSHHRARENAAPGGALHVSVVNGDLVFVQQPLLIGHYRSMQLTGTELVIDRLVGNTMRHSLELGQYPEAPGTHQIFMNTRRDRDAFKLPRPEAVVVVGLGEEGKLTAPALVETVRLGVIAWAQRVLEKPGAPAVFDIAATLIGSGGKGISVAQSAQLVAEAVRAATERLASRNWPRVRRLQFIELYLDRATEAWGALKLQAEAAPSRYQVAETIQVGNGARGRPLDSGYRGAHYDLITASTHEDSGRKLIAYSLDTKRARTEVTAQITQPPLIHDLLGPSNSLDGATSIGRTLFNVLVPVEIEPFLGGSDEIVLELDSGTAGIPWELLDTDTGARQDGEPWAIRTKMVRRLRTVGFRRDPLDANPEASVLVIGEPKCPDGYPRLPGARDEANAVIEQLYHQAALKRQQVVGLVRIDDTSDGPDARAVLTALYERPWRIVHVAGHGAPTKDAKNPGGVVLSNQTFLSATEFNNLRTVPELVFVNCCYLAARNVAQLLTAESPLAVSYDRPRFAADVATALIDIGVRCVVAAGWAVDDSAAKAFAAKFYERLFMGERFIDAVKQARKAAREFGGNTWAAYQCYGDPEWTFKRSVSDAQSPAETSSSKYASIASFHALKLALDSIATESRLPQNDTAMRDDSRRRDQRRDEIRYLQERFGKIWGNIGEVAEAFGAAWVELGDPESAIQWYERALGANDGSASLRAAEQLGNQRARLAWNRVSQSIQQMRKPQPEAGAPQAPAARSCALGRAKDEIKQAISWLEKIASLQPSMERESLLGSAYKRLALVEAAAQRTEEEAQAIQQMSAHYVCAVTLGRASGSADLFYPAINHLVAELVLNAGKPGWTGLDPDSVEIVRNSLSAKVRTDPDFWSVVGETELQLYEALSRRDLSSNRTTIEQEFKDVYERVSAVNMWRSVYDNAEFVLPKYAARAAKDEKRAAGEVLSLLRRFAGVN
jgi:tetratricopeptide (TPR) repeat protein